MQDRSRRRVVAWVDRVSNDGNGCLLVAVECRLRTSDLYSEQLLLDLCFDHGKHAS